DLRGEEKREVHFNFKGGIQSFVEYLDRNKKPLIKSPVTVMSEQNGITVEASMEWTDAYHESMLCFTNNIPQRDGGTHLQGFRNALTRVLNSYAEEKGMMKKEKVKLAGEDM